MANNNEAKATNLLLVVNEQHKTFNIRTQRDPDFRDSLIFWRASATKQMKKGYDMGPRQTANQYLAKHGDKCVQSILMRDVVFEDRQVVKKAFRKLYRDNGYIDFANTECKMKLESGEF